MTLLRIFSVLLVFSTVLSTSAGVIFPFDTSWKFMKGVSEASAPDTTAWRKPSFDDSGWETAQSPFWYGDVLPGGTELSDMRGSYTCIFIRKTFVISNPQDVSELHLDSLSDDGYIMWINGQEVHRYNMPDGDVAFNGTASPALAEPIPLETTVLANPASYLVAGTNVIAVQGFNSSLRDSSDFGLEITLSSTVDETPPVVTDVIPSAFSKVRALTDIEVHFSEPVDGVDAADLLINNSPATNLVFAAPGVYVFQFPQPSTGAVQVAWASAHGIHDLAGAANPFAGGSWSYTLDPNAPIPGLMISEFMAANDKTLHDEDGDSSDWIELYNPTSSAADLTGWYLTDERQNLAKWRFPSVSIPANGYLLVFASEKNRTNPIAPLHTNFKLEQAGEYLGLVSPTLNIVSEFAPFPEQHTDVSYGRDQAVPDVLGYFTSPTPRAANAKSGPGFSADVKFSQNGGTFSGPFALTLTVADTNAVTHYTLDGSLPSETSPIYSGPIQITATTQVRARSFTPGLLPGDPHSESYLALNANVVNFSSDLPILVIHNHGAGRVPANTDQYATIQVFEPVNGRSSLTNAPQLSGRSGINIRGSSTEGYPKSSFAVEFWDDFNQDKDRPLLDLPEDSDWVLYAPNNFEPVLIHNPFIYELSNEIGRYAPRTRFVEVYLNTTGGPVIQANYNGIYVLEERIKRGKDRVDIDNLEPENVTVPSVTGGYMLKVDRLDPGDNGLNAAGQSMAYVDPKEREIELPQRDPQETYIRNYLNAFGTALNGANFANPITGYAQYIDSDAWIDHHILNVMAFNVDALRLSAYFYKPRNGKLVFGPIWDFDRALGSTDGRDSVPTVWKSQTSDGGTDFFNYTWWGRLFQDINFWQKWIDRWQDLRKKQLSTTSMNALIDTMANEVRQAQPREQSRWGITPRGGSYQGEVNLMKSWLKSRTDWIDGQFLPAPLIGTPGGTVTAGTQVQISLPAAGTGTIYYTLDGSDPRLPGGNVSPIALTYSSPISINQNTRIIARALDQNHRNTTGAGSPPLSSPWSGSVSETFVVGTIPLTVTEIMYHPAPPSAGNTNDADNFEFIELKNTGTTTLDLTGIRFTAGITFGFTGSSVTSLAPGGRVLVVKDLAAFNSRYLGATNVAGVYQGSLDNNGEHLILTGSAGETILDFDYHDSWYPTTDGPGFSLVLADESVPANQLGQKASWRASAQVNGSPGTADTLPVAVPGILVNEALTHTDLPQVDAIELYNPTTAAVDLGGWFLTDDFNTPKKYRIPAGTIIQANGYLLFDETQFNALPEAPLSFSLSSLGDQVYLFSGDNSTNLTGYYHGFKFGAAENGVTFGRYVPSAGDEQFVAQAQATLGSTNAGPKVGPLIISEVMYNPSPLPGSTNSNTLGEYIEVYNATSAPISLFDPNASTNTWHIDGGVQFTFPGGVTLAGKSSLLIVGFDPAANSTNLATFLSFYKLDSSSNIFGPFKGNLDNSGDKIQLLKPDKPQLANEPSPGLAPYVLVDEVDYNNATPWPLSPNGQGPSLQRVAAFSFGNDPASWQAGASSPGKTDLDQGPVDSDGDGLPDDWELANGLDPHSSSGINGASGDPDGDGLTNMQEYVAGTNPQSASSALKLSSIQAQSSTVSLHFTAVQGKSYTIQYRDDLAQGIWLKLKDLPAAATTSDTLVTDSAAPSKASRFYRIVTPAVP